MFGMELWFVFAVGSALIGGFGAFGNKIAAQRKYSTELVVILTALITLSVFLPAALWFEGRSVATPVLIGITVIAGLFTSLSQLIKIQVLHYIDSAIFLPLFKSIGPLIVIIFGMLFLSESFSTTEWIGLFFSLTVPLLLVSRIEHIRQNNLSFGLLLIVVAAITSAIAAAIQKYATNLQELPLWIVSAITVGVLIGSTSLYVLKHRGSLVSSIKQNYSFQLLKVALLRGLFASSGFYLTILAYVHGGPLGIVYTINSLYILVPIILAIIFYNEHWNLRKVFAIVLSVAALGLLQ